jgi:hypothetical protein
VFYYVAIIHHRSSDRCNLEKASIEQQQQDEALAEHDESKNAD